MKPSLKNIREIGQTAGSCSDIYFSRVVKVLEKFGDCQVTYAVFMRRPVIVAARFATDWLENQARLRDAEIKITHFYQDGEWAGSGETLYHVEGAFSFLVEAETMLLQKTGPACVAAYNAYSMCKTLPDTAFIAMDARHNTGMEMTEIMSYAAATGSMASKKECQSKGFIGNSITETAHYFGNKKGLGTMPHALIGYAGSTVRAAEMMDQTFPDTPLTVLVDYFGHEITDSLAVCHKLRTRVDAGTLSIRLDTPGGRFCENLDPAASYDALNRNAPDAIKDYRTEKELNYLIGSGVSVAAIWYLRENLDKAGFNKVSITASSGFSPAKCKAMALGKAPVDVIGTGSFLPNKWQETYATADIINYDGVAKVKAGREFLLKNTP